MCMRIIMTSPGVCPVCCESYTAYTRRSITCPVCTFSACRSCHQQYFTNATSFPDCMKCHDAFSLGFIAMHFPKQWVREHMQPIILKRELDQMPEHQHCVRNYRIAEELKARNAVLGRMQRSIIEERWNLKNRLDRIIESEYDDDGLNGPTRLAGAPGSIRRCPVKGCRGFLTTTLHCGVCNAKTCNECWQPFREEDAEEHVCDEANIETTRTLQHDTRPCPSCGIRIMKSDGCHQMWCVACKTAFMWHTGAIVRGPVHNPHYFDHIRRTQSEEHDVIRFFDIDRKLREPMDDATVRLGRALPEYEAIMTYWRHLVELRLVVNTMRRRRVGEDVPIRDLRLRYLLGEIHPEDLKKLLWKRYMQFSRDIALCERYTEKIQHGTSCIGGLLRDEISPRDLVHEFLRVHVTVNAELRTIEKIYSARPDYGPPESLFVII